jgi:hypothetical protein
MVFMCARPFRAEGWPMLTDAIASAASGAGKSGDSYIRFHCYNVPQIDLPVKRFFQNVVHIRDSRTPQETALQALFREQETGNSGKCHCCPLAVGLGCRIGYKAQTWFALSLL